MIPNFPWGSNKVYLLTYLLTYLLSVIFSSFAHLPTSTVLQVCGSIYTIKLIYATFAANQCLEADCISDDLLAVRHRPLNFETERAGLCISRYAFFGNKRMMQQHNILRGRVRPSEAVKKNRKFDFISMVEFFIGWKERSWTVQDRTKPL